MYVLTTPALAAAPIIRAELLSLAPPEIATTASATHIELRSEQLDVLAGQQASISGTLTT